MKNYVKNFKQWKVYEQETEKVTSSISPKSNSLLLRENTGADTNWIRTHDGIEITITMKDVIKYLDDKEVSVENINTELIEPLLIETDRDPKRVAGADLEYPIFISKRDGELKSILDGQHRLAKAITNDIKEIKARVLDLDTAPDDYQMMFR